MVCFLVCTKAYRAGFLFKLTTWVKGKGNSVEYFRATWLCLQTDTHVFHTSLSVWMQLKLLHADNKVKLVPADWIDPLICYPTPWSAAFCSSWRADSCFFAAGALMVFGCDIKTKVLGTCARYRTLFAQPVLGNFHLDPAFLHFPCSLPRTW